MTANAPNYRRQIVDQLIPFAEKDPRIILFVSDMGFGVTDKFKTQFPNRMFNVGIMEQGAVGIAAGMAMSGWLPVFYSIVNFIVYRSIEQIRNDVVLQKMNVKFIATGVNDYFEFLGPSHCCGQDDIQLMKMIGMPEIVDPYSHKEEEFPSLVEKWITSNQPGYIRV